MWNDEPSGTRRPRVLLIELGPLVSRALQPVLDRAEVSKVGYPSAAFEEARGESHEIVVLDLTRLGDPVAAQRIGDAFAGRGTRIVFVGYAHDEGEERRLAERCGALFNPSIEAIDALVRRASRGSEPPIAAQPGRPAGYAAARRGSNPGGIGGDPMDLMRQLQVRLDNLSLDREKGQTLVEYGLILALIAVVTVVALTLLGTNVTARLNSIANSIGA